MQTNRTLAGLVGALLLLFGAAAPAAAEEAAVFVDVHVLPMDSDRVLANHDVLVVGDRIAAIGPTGSVEIPEGAQRIEGGGARYLMPGMAELHGHIPAPTEPQSYIEDVLLLFVANGVTTVRGMLGHPNQLALRDEANRGELLAPTLYLAGPPFDRGIDGPQAAAERVRAEER